MKLQSLLVALSICAAAPVYAADDTPTEVEPVVANAAAKDVFRAVPDRPTFSAAATTVDAGHGQLEIGTEFATAAGASQLSFPVLARVGVAEFFELRLGLPSIVFPFGDAESELGALQLGAKVAGDVTQSLSLGALPYFDIAASSEGQRTFSQSTYGFLFLWGFGLTDSFGIGGNLGAAVGPGSTDEAGPRELFYAASLTASMSMGDLGLTLEGFTELGQFAEPNVGGSLSAGYAIFDTLIVDLYGGSSAQAGATNVFAGAGLSIAR